MQDTIVQYDKWSSIKKYSSIDMIKLVAGILFLCSSLLKAVIRIVVPYFALREFLLTLGYDLVLLLLIAIAYLDRGFRKRKLRVWPIYLFSLVAIVGSLVFNPEYSEWFNHEEYGMDIRFWHLTCAMWGLLIFGLFTDKRKLLTMLVYSCRLNMLWHLYEYRQYLIRGYWLAYSGSGELMRLDYGLGYGYRVVICVVLFLGLYVYNKRLVDLISFIVTLLLTIVCGSRGPLICIAAAVVILYISKWREKKALAFRFISILILLILGLTVLVVGLPVLSNGLMVLLRRSNLSGRAIQMLLSGTITDDSGRSDIYDIAFNMIRNGGLFGYGFYGDRYIIGRTWHYGYPHNIFLEWMIQFGPILGGILSGVLLYNILRMLIRCEDTTWQLLLLVTFTSSIKLCMSDSFWYYWPFWGLLAVLGLWHKEWRRTVQRKKARIRLSIR